MTTPDKYEKSVLTRLATKYRNSRKGLGIGVINRKTSLTPSAVLKGYDDPYIVSAADYEAFNAVLRTLESKGFVRLVYVGEHSTNIKEIILVDSAIDDIENYLSVKYGLLTYTDGRAGVLDLIHRYKGTSRACDCLCKELSELVESKKPIKPFRDMSLDDTIVKYEDALKALSFIENNSMPLYCREASMLIFGTSKRLDSTSKDGLLEFICKYLMMAYEIDSDESVDILIERFNIFKEAETIQINGDIVFEFTNGKVLDISSLSHGLTFSSLDIASISHVRVNTPVFMTIENKTSYMRYKKNDVSTFFLSGFMTGFQGDLLTKIRDDNPDVVFYHFGDIDVGGFRILNALNSSTGIPFQPFEMSVEVLSDERYRNCLVTLTDDEVYNLSLMISSPLYSDYIPVLEYMITHKVKLEQEIVSLTLMTG